LLTLARMGRVPRHQLVAHNTTNHITFRSHNGMMLFEEQAVADHFLHLLSTHKQKYGIRIHSFCLMGTHPHLVITATEGQKAFSEFWKVVNHGLARFVNRRLARKGQVIMERMRSPTIKPDGRHLLTVMRYGDLNPVRAGLCRSPKKWKYSSYNHYAYGKKHPLIDDAPDYVALAQSPARRRLAYRDLLRRQLVADLMKRRPDLVNAPFIGDRTWMNTKRSEAGLAPLPDG
jgi:putative transposase